MAGVAAYDGNVNVYFGALHGLQAGWGDPTKMAEAIWPVLCDWHAEYYHWGSGDPTAIASAITRKIGLVDGFRNRTIDTMCKADEPKIRELFWEFQKATGRTNRNGLSGSPVGAAKAMHLLPAFPAFVGRRHSRSLPLRSRRLWLRKVLPTHETTRCDRASLPD